MMILTRRFVRKIFHRLWDRIMKIRQSSQMKADKMFRANSAALILLAVVGGGSVTQQAQAGVPKNMVAFMANSGQSQCPDAWTEASYAQGRLILGTIHAETIRVAVGDPMGDAKVPIHTHTTTLHSQLGPWEGWNTPGGPVTRVGPGSVTVHGLTAPSETQLPFIQFLVCENTKGAALDTLPYGAIAYFNATACPTNWVHSTEADGRFVLPAGVGAKPGYATEAWWYVGKRYLHQHTLNSSFGTVNEMFVSAFLGDHGPFVDPSRRYDLSGETPLGGDNFLPYVSLLACEKTMYGTSEDIPPGLVMSFNAANCPDDWGLTIGANGRFFVGIGGNGTQGAVFGSNPIGPRRFTVSHKHLFSGEGKSVSLPSAPWTGTIGPGYLFAIAATFYAGTSNSVDTPLPVLVINSCTKL